MKLLFAHDHVFYLDDMGDFYSPGKLNNTSFDRYFDSFSSVTIVSRFKKCNDQSLLSTFNKIDREGVNFIPFDNLSNLKNRFLKYNHYKKLIKSIINQHDGVVVRLPSEIGFLVAKCASEFNVPYATEVVACPKDAMSGFATLKSRLYSPIIVSEMKKAVFKAAGAIYVTSDFLQKRYPCSGFVSSASNVEISESVDRKIIDKISTKQCVDIALVGNLDSFHKGYDTVYEAAKLLDTGSRHYKFLLVGPGQHFKRSFHTENIVFSYPGAMKLDEVVNLLDSVDLYIQPSNQEGLPRATIEAMSRGLPAIVSNAGGLPELIDHNFVHEVGDHRMLATLICQLTNDDRVYSEQSSKNTKTASQFIRDNLKEIRANFYADYALCLK
ncbi:glycosyltransferase [Photobacterium sp. DA100]|uniref:glycosyltransferase family 4 protein n=1 Tax=Photobacterium sp. DA100 TaxID=3027472 RepID=UPI002479969B|nr:glycosyltransferase [Photobacterium sp. DA100]WEM41554.1 glycosyltransferase [Photobacterium sp. DA100]